jgi:hypothetical protein
MHPDATKPDYRAIDAHLLGVALGCGFFGFGAGAFYAIHEYLWMGIFLAVAVLVWVSARYYVRHPSADDDHPAGS